MRHFSRILRSLYLVIMVVVICFPVYLLLTGSITGQEELVSKLTPVLESSGTGEKISWTFLPQFPTLKNLIELIFDTPEYYVVFFNSIKIVLATLAGQLLVGVPGAWAFARFTFPGKRILFTTYVILMIMPFQVTMLSNYIVINNIGLMDSLWSIIIPAIFSTFPVFIMYRSFKDLPDGLLEAARIDGAGEWSIFWKIGIPMGSSGILSAMILDFLECFSMVEQPLAFLKNKSNWPIALYLPEISAEQAGFAFAASVVSLIPAVFIFLLGQDYLEQGIIASAIKE